MLVAMACRDTPWASCIIQPASPLATLWRADGWWSGAVDHRSGGAAPGDRRLREASRLRAVASFSASTAVHTDRPEAFRVVPTKGFGGVDREPAPVHRPVDEH